ncbi:MAG: hypothetical protein Q8N44_13410 [Rubrivivax sp.]|nr:hypothetical protein [Rubrivivax sp.]MDP3084668.1 hypothetical protein [Rubrivivax sp.]
MTMPDIFGLMNQALSARVFTLGGLLAALVFIIGSWWFSSFLERRVNRLSQRGTVEH